MNNPIIDNSWNELYKNTPVEIMPWFRESLDYELLEELKTRKITKGSFLDIGSGPGTHAAALAKSGFKVTATDIAVNAVEQAQKKYPNVAFITDNIANTNLSGKFDYVLDRGCFHVLDPVDYNKYVTNVHNLLNAEGFLFLKCFSDKEPSGSGPARISKDLIMTLFSVKFHIEKITDVEFLGVRSPYPKAYFSVLKKI